MANKMRPRLADYKTTIKITTRWMDNDVYGHVNNVIYYSWFDTAVNHYLMDQNVLDFSSGDVVGLVVETGCQYFSSVAFPDTITAGLRVANIGNSSVRYEIGLFRNEETIASAAGHFIHVYVNRASSMPVRVPDKFRSVLQAVHV